MQVVLSESQIRVLNGALLMVERGARQVDNIPEKLWVVRNMVYSLNRRAPVDGVVTFNREETIEVIAMLEAVLTVLSRSPSMLGVAVQNVLSAARPIKELRDTMHYGMKAQQTNAPCA